MGVKRFSATDTVIKVISPSTALTIGATVTQTSSAFDLGVDRKFSAAKAIYIAAKAGTAGVLDAVMSVTTGPTNAAAGAFMAAQAVGTALNTGHAPASAVDIVRVLDIDLNNVLCDRWIKVVVAVTGTASDTSTGRILLLLEGPREQPVSTLGTNAMDTT